MYCGTIGCSIYNIFYISPKKDNCYRYSQVKPRNFLIFVPKKYGEF